MASLEEMWEQKGKTALIVPESKIEIVEIEDAKKEDTQEETTSSNELSESITNEKIERIKRDIQHKKSDRIFSKVTSAVMISIGTIGTIAALIATKHSFGKVESMHVFVGICGLAAPCYIVGAGEAVAGKLDKEDIDILEEELDEEVSSEINKILLIER